MQLSEACARRFFKAFIVTVKTWKKPHKGPGLEEYSNKRQCIPQETPTVSSEMGDFANWQEGWVFVEMTYIAESVQRLTQNRPSGLGLLTDSLFLLI